MGRIHGSVRRDQGIRTAALILRLQRRMDLSGSVERTCLRLSSRRRLPSGKQGRDHAQDDPFAYNYNDACTAFANGESAMYCIGSYAVPQIQSVNPDMDIDSFVMPGCDNADDNVLNSGVDLQFCVTSECKNKEAAYEVLQFMLEDSTIQTYLDDQNAVPCKDKEFELSPALDSMVDYINEGKMVDYQDHYYPAEMSVDAQIQTFLLDGDVEKFLNKFDTDWVRYNRDIIRKVQEYEEKGGNE